MGADHVLGAIVIAAIMLSGVAFVVTYDPHGPSAEQAIERQLEQNAEDFLYVYKDWPLDEPCIGANMLERFIIDGTNGDHTEWERRVRKFFPLGTDTSLLLSNGHGVYPLHEKFEVVGATNDLALQPDWSYTFPTHQTDVADGDSRAPLELPSLFYSELVAPRGEAIETTVSFTSLDGAHVRTGWGLTALMNLTGNGSTLASVGWRLQDEHRHRLWVDLPAEELLFIQDLRLTVGDLTAVNASNLSVLIPLPQGWTLTFTRSPSTNWTTVEDRSGVSQHSVRFTLNGTPLPGEQEFIIRAKPPANVTRPFDVITAQFSNGSLAQSSLVVTYPVQAERSLPREAFLTMPYPLQVGGTGLFGVAFANGGPEIVVNQIDFEIPGGYDIPKNDGQGAELFASFSEPITSIEQLTNESERGSWTYVGGRHVQWTGNRTIPAGSAGEWLVELPITDDASQVTSVERSGAGPEAEVEFENGFSARSTAWGASPGIVRVRVPADDPTTSDVEGYPSTQGAHAYTAHLRDDGLRLSASGTLTVDPVAGGDAVNMEHALANSSFVVDRRLVPVGGLLDATFRGESLVTELAAAGGTVAKLAVKLYAPPSLGCKPTAVWERDASALPLAAVHDARATHFDGVDAVFFVGDDKSVHRLTADGTPVWVNRLSSNGVLLETASFGPADQGVFVGTSYAMLHRLDPLTGVEEQRVAIARPSLSGGTGVPHAVTSLWVDESRGLVLVGTSLGVVEVRNAAGFETHQRVLTGERVLQVRSAGDGDVLVLTEKRMLRYSPTLALEASTNVIAPVGFAAPTASTLLIAQDGETLVLDAHSLSRIGPGAIAHDGTIGMAAAGDATGDGVEDMVVALDDATLRVVDGALLKGVWTKSPTIADLDELLPLPVFASAESLRSTQPGAVQGFGREEFKADCSTPTYGEESYCTWMLPDADVLDEDEKRHLPSPLGLDVRDGRVAYSAWNGRESVVRVFDGQGNELSSTTSAPGVRTTSVDLGSWLLAEKLVTGTDQGALVVTDRDSQTETYRTAATDFVGLFTFTMAVPKGGFYGTHLLVAELTWRTTENEERHARLLDWFTVGDAEGKAVTKPSYRLVMVVDQPEDS